MQTGLAAEEMIACPTPGCDNRTFGKGPCFSCASKPRLRAKSFRVKIEISCAAEIESKNGQALPCSSFFGEGPEVTDLALVDLRELLNEVIVSAELDSWTTNGAGNWFCPQHKW